MSVQVWRRIWLVAILTILFSTSVFASMPPNEIEKRKGQASLHVTGKIIEDHLIKESTDDADLGRQIRQAKLQVLTVIKQPANIDVRNQTILIDYHYLPPWSWEDYAGGHPYDLYVGDEIEVWLEPSETNSQGWEPMLGGYTVFYLKKVPDRPPHKKEPLGHFLRRVDIMTPVLKGVFVAVILTYLYVLLRANKKTNRP